MPALGIYVHAVCDSSIQVGFELPRSHHKVQSVLVLFSERRMNPSHSWKSGVFSFLTKFQPGDLNVLESTIS